MPLGLRVNAIFRDFPHPNLQFGGPGSLLARAGGALGDEHGNVDGVMSIGQGWACPDCRLGPCGKWLTSV